MTVQSRVKNSKYARDQEKNVRLTVIVQPRSSRNSVELVEDQVLRVSLTAPPVEGEANKMLRSFLSEVLHVPKTAIAIVKGDKGRKKIVEICGCSSKDVAVRVSSL